jgi:hypothetical protein
MLRAFSEEFRERAVGLKEVGIVESSAGLNPCEMIWISDLLRCSIRYFLT